MLQARHIGISAQDEASMLQTVGVSTLDELIEQTIPSAIRLQSPIELPEPLTERQYAEHISEIASKKQALHIVYWSGLVRYHYTGSYST